jgi:pantetheine-phosphate adenylyltransferase
MRVGFYAGSFDPFTIGHLHIVKSASQMFDKVIVGMGVNVSKARRFDKEAMIEAMMATFKREGLNNVECVIYDGLTYDVALANGATVLIRGIRNGMDYDYEENLAQVNFELGGLDTVYLRAGDYGMVSSSMVYELIKREKDASKYLPVEILKLVKGE